MKIVSYNVNGIRAALTKELISWLSAVDPDIFCVQETKAEQSQVDISEFINLGYHYNYWHSAQKKGYSGVAIFSKIKPLNIHYGCGYECYDMEGRSIKLDFDTFSLINVYMPSGSSGDERQVFKYQFMNDYYDYTKSELFKTPNLIIVGDYNICHHAIDIHNPISNAKSSGFLPEERAWLTKYTELGLLDTFRLLNNEPQNYTWWSYRAGSRKKNLGWRIDYQMISTTMQNRLTRALILKDAIHSDHCPTLLEID